MAEQTKEVEQLLKLAEKLTFEYRLDQRERKLFKETRAADSTEVYKGKNFKELHTTLLKHLPVHKPLKRVHMLTKGNWKTKTFILRDTSQPVERANSAEEDIMNQRIIKCSAFIDDDTNELLFEWFISKYVSPMSPFVLRAVERPFVLSGLPGIKQPRCCVDLCDLINRNEINDAEMLYTMIAMLSVLCKTQGNFLHGDLRPENIFIKYFPQPTKLMITDGNTSSDTKRTLIFRNVSLHPLMADFGMSLLKFKENKTLHDIGYNCWTYSEMNPIYDVVFFFTWMYVFYDEILEDLFSVSHMLVKRVISLSPELEELAEKYREKERRDHATSSSYTDATNSDQQPSEKVSRPSSECPPSSSTASVVMNSESAQSSIYDLPNQIPYNKNLLPKNVFEVAYQLCMQTRALHNELFFDHELIYSQ
jgi:hypothetical protein